MLFQFSITQFVDEINGQKKKKSKARLWVFDKPKSLFRIAAQRKFLPGGI